MHTYPFHGGDFLKDTAHWSEVETTVPIKVGLVRELAYRRLLDLYYGQEGPIPNRTHWVAIRVRMLAHAEIVGSVLKEKFELKDGFWHQKRADEEIAKYQKRVVANQENGKKGGRKPAGNPPGNPVGSKPRTRTNTDSPLPPEGELGFMSFWTKYPNKAKKPQALKAWTKVVYGNSKVKPRATMQELDAGLARHLTCVQWTKDGGQFIPHASSWLNADGWTVNPLQPADTGDAPNWWETRDGIFAKGVELAIPAPPDESPQAFIRFKASVWVAAGHEGPWWDRTDTAYATAVKLRDGGNAVAAQVLAGMKEATHGA